MTHFLASLVDRARGTASRVEPVIPSRFTSAGLPEMETEIEPLGMPHEQLTPARKDSPEPHAKAEGGIEEETRPTETNGVRDPNIETAQLLVAERFRPTPDADSRPSLEHSHGTPGEPHAATSRSRRADRKTSRASLAPTLQPTPRGPHVSDDHEKEAPVVRVTIGRIEVRAAPAPTPSPRKPARNAGPVLTLDAYLKSRKDGAP
jgi:hypothetical protein